MSETANSPLRGDSFREDLPALLLVGGMGTRLRPVLSSKPKPLAPIGDVPFLELLILQLRSQGIRRLVMCTGFQTQQIEEALGDGRKWDVAIEYSKESSPLGTAGAIKQAEHLLSGTSDFLVMNGDVYVFKRAVLQHIPEGPGSLEKDVLPRLVEHGTFALEQTGMFIDIGTPEDYARAQALYQQLSDAALSLPRCESQRGFHS